MMKSILFIGPQGSGKTTKIQTLLSCLNRKQAIELTMAEFRKLNAKALSAIFDVVVVDSITNGSELSELLYCAEFFDLFFLVATQLQKNQFFDRDLSMFHVVELSNGTAG